MDLSLNPTIRQQQLTVIKNYVEANHQVNGSGVYDQSTANAMNQLAAPQYVVYRVFVPMQEIMANGFDWTRVDNLGVGKARIWEWMERAYVRGGIGGLNPSKPECREGINTVWVGTAADRAVRDAVYTHCYRVATIAEALLASGDGTVPVADGDGSGPGTPGDGAEGDITVANLQEAEANG